MRRLKLMRHRSIEREAGQVYGGGGVLWTILVVLAIIALLVWLL